MEEMEELLDTGLALKPPDILHDLIDVLRRDAFDFRHIAEFPMVRLPSVGRGPLKCGASSGGRITEQGIAESLDRRGNPLCLCGVTPLVSLFLFVALCLYSAQFVHPANTLITPVLDRDDGPASKMPRRSSCITPRCLKNRH